jgi:hypothetical protein
MERKAFHTLPSFAVLLILTLTLSVGASAATLQIASYDIAQTPESGFGCWFNNYTGTITATGLTVGGSVNCSPFNPARVLNYSNGSGTLNDGLFDTTQLLMTRISDQGQQLQPVITLRFGGIYTINEIRLLKGNNGFTNITGVTVQIGGTALSVTPTPIGGDPLSVLLDLRGTALAVLPTNQLVLGNFSASFFGSPIDQFGIGEVVVDGSEVVLSPTTKDQCKDGGWSTFGFKNEGQCLQFVITGK